MATKVDRRIQLTELQRLNYFGFILKGTAKYIGNSTESPISAIKGLFCDDHSGLHQEFAVIAQCRGDWGTTYGRLAPMVGGQPKSGGLQPLGMGRLPNFHVR